MWHASEYHHAGFRDLVGFGGICFYLSSETWICDKAETMKMFLV